MTDSPPSTPPEESTAATAGNSKKWPLWLGIGFFSLVGVALAISLVRFWGEESAPPTLGEPAPEAAPAVNAPSDFRAHQQLVSDVVNDLDREVLVGDSPTRGNPDADIVLLEFSDFQCPYCAQATTEVDAFVDAHEADVLLVYKHLPLTNIHPEALPAALASWAADQQDQFWPFHDVLFANQEQLGEALYVQTAQELGLDMEQFNRDRASEAAKAAVARDLALASEFQLTGTPTFILDRLLIPGMVPADFFAEALTRLQAEQR